MRIIAGEFRGRKLLPPKTDATRPITDRVKQSLFDVLTPYLDGAKVLDLFAGTGSLGLEAISRGAAHATFFEMDRSAASILRRNIDTFSVADRCTVVSADIFACRRFSAASIVFLDPPYRMLNTHKDELRKLAQTLAERAMEGESLLIFRHAAADALDLPPFQRYDERRYGEMVIEFLKKRM
jgi:16S rRNA (guanine966-N2)-methyltransferase